MSSDEVAIRVRSVSKHYAMFAKPEDRLKQMVMPRLHRLAGRQPRRYFTDFAAVNDVSFEVRRGETVGIIGRNGSGKSTTLQMVCGTLQPTSGSIEVNGRIAALLELGAGFNPEFTGRENVYLNAAILGLSRAETDERFDDIARFADIGMFIDQPVKTYSSGMYVRLAFAVAINVDPDILVVDEALSVGDEAFQRKCFARIEDIRSKGGTILFVSHGAQTIIQLCDRAMLFDRGELLLEGKPKTVVSQYQRLANLSGDEALVVREQIRLGISPPADKAAASPIGDVEKISSLPVPRSRFDDLSAQGSFDPGLISQSRVSYESQGANIRSPRLVDSTGQQVNVIEAGGRYAFEYEIDFEVDARNVQYGMLIKTVEGLALAGAASSSQALPTVSAGDMVHVHIEFEARFTSGTYFANVGVLGTTGRGGGYLHRILDAITFRILPNESSSATGLVDLDVATFARIERAQEDA